jgi:hypothetical protein
MQGGVAAAASNLLFAGKENGDSNALGTKTGEKLWNFCLGVGAMAPKVTYRIGDVQHIAVPFGGGYTKFEEMIGRFAYGSAVAILLILEIESFCARCSSSR